VRYDRLLCGKRVTKSFTVSNLGVLPFKWQLAGAWGMAARGRRRGVEAMHTRPAECM
jgi:hypothetical protein